MQTYIGHVFEMLWKKYLHNIVTYNVLRTIPWLTYMSRAAPYSACWPVGLDGHALS